MTPQEQEIYYLTNRVISLEIKTAELLKELNVLKLLAPRLAELEKSCTQPKNCTLKRNKV